MGATGVLHKSQKGDAPLFEKKGRVPFLPDQWPSDPAARRISVGATCDSSLR